MTAFDKATKTLNSKRVYSRFYLSNDLRFVHGFHTQWLSVCS